MSAPDPTPEDMDKLVTLLRRALVRLNAVEGRLAVVEERLHHLEDLRETVQGLERLGSRVMATDAQLKTYIANSVDKRVRKMQKP